LYTIAVSFGKIVHNRGFSANSQLSFSCVSEELFF
jgi:hypothetical protein